MGGNKKAKAKTSQALREGAPVVRAQLKKEMPGVILSGGVKKRRKRVGSQSENTTINLDNKKKCSRKSIFLQAMLKRDSSNLTPPTIAIVGKTKTNINRRNGLFSVPVQHEHKKNPIAVFCENSVPSNEEVSPTQPLHRFPKATETATRPRSRVFQLSPTIIPNNQQSSPVTKKQKNQYLLPLSQEIKNPETFLHTASIISLKEFSSSHTPTTLTAVSGNLSNISAPNSPLFQERKKNTNKSSHSIWYFFFRRIYLYA